MNTMYYKLMCNDVSNCYSSDKDYRMLIDMLWKNELPKEEINDILMYQDGSTRISAEKFHEEYLRGNAACYVVDFDNEAIRASLPWGISQEIEHFGNVPYGAAISLLRPNAPNTDYEMDEFLDMDELYGGGKKTPAAAASNRYIECSSEGRQAGYADYLLATGNYPEMYVCYQDGKQYIAFDKEGNNNIQSALSLKAQNAVYNLYISEVPLYKETYAYACLHGEREQYRQSQNESVKCARAIERVLEQGYDVPIRDFVVGWGTERLKCVIANTCANADGFREDLRQWGAANRPAEYSENMLIHTDNDNALAQLLNCVYDVELENTDKSEELEDSDMEMEY